MDYKIIAVGFDGTLCENKWPEIGTPNLKLIAYLKECQAAGDKLVLWTCRVGEILKNAIDWSAEQGIIFDAVNENLQEVLEWMGGDSRKIFANEYIDDRNAWYPKSQLISEERPQSERMELWGGLIDVVEDWLEEKGITANDIPNEGREDTEDVAIIYGSDYDYLTDRFAAVVGISRDCLDVVGEEKAETRSDEGLYKDKIYIIGSITQKEKIKNTAEYYMGTGRYEVRYVKEEPRTAFDILVDNCFSNILWADRIYVVPKSDGTLGKGVTYEVAFAKLMGKYVDIFMTEPKFDSLLKGEKHD